MAPNNLNLMLQAFELFAKGFTQKEIAQKLEFTEKTISKWKVRFNWEERLLTIASNKTTFAYMLIEENIRQQANAKTKAARLLLDEAASLNDALTTLHQVLKENNLIGPV